jgi:glycerophosphoryl diester phosphodiesterase
VEIKQEGEIGLDALSELLRIIEAKGAQNGVVIGSFHEEVFDKMVELKKSGKDFMFSPAQKGVVEFLVPSWLMLDTFYCRPVSVMQVPMSQGPIKVATRAFIYSAHRHNIAVQFWTINDENDMRRLIQIGADGIMTDYPSLLKSVMDE